MTSVRQLSRVAALLVAVAVLFAACGDTTDDEQLPINDDTTQDEPLVTGACAEGEPDCIDTVVGGDDPSDLPSDDEPNGRDEPGAISGGALVDGGLSVSQALSTDATGTIAVKGFIVDNGVEARLCELLAESMPPQCGGASVPVVGYDQLDLGVLSSAQGIIWSDGFVVVFGEMIDGTLVANPGVAG